MPTLRPCADDSPDGTSRTGSDGKHGTARTGSDAADGTSRTGSDGADGTSSSDGADGTSSCDGTSASNSTSSCDGTSASNSNSVGASNSDGASNSNGGTSASNSNSDGASNSNSDGTSDGTSDSTSDSATNGRHTSVFTDLNSFRVFHGEGMSIASAQQRLSLQDNYLEGSTANDTQQLQQPEGKQDDDAAEEGIQSRVAVTLARKMPGVMTLQNNYRSGLMLALAIASPGKQSVWHRVCSYFFAMAKALEVHPVSLCMDHKELLVPDGDCRLIKPNLLRDRGWKQMTGGGFIQSHHKALIESGHKLITKDWGDLRDWLNQGFAHNGTSVLGFGDAPTLGDMETVFRKNNCIIRNLVFSWKDAHTNVNTWDEVVVWMGSNMRAAVTEMEFTRIWKGKFVSNVAVLRAQSGDAEEGEEKEEKEESEEESEEKGQSEEDEEEPKRKGPINRKRLAERQDSSQSSNHSSSEGSLTEPEVSPPNQVGVPDSVGSPEQHADDPSTLSSPSMGGQATEGAVGHGVVTPPRATVGRRRRKKKRKNNRHLSLQRQLPLQRTEQAPQQEQVQVPQQEQEQDVAASVSVSVSMNDDNVDSARLHHHRNTTRNQRRPVRIVRVELTAAAQEGEAEEEPDYVDSDEEGIHDGENNIVMERGEWTQMVNTESYKMMGYQEDISVDEMETMNLKFQRILEERNNNDKALLDLIQYFGRTYGTKCLFHALRGACFSPTIIWTIYYCPPDRDLHEQDFVGLANRTELQPPEYFKNGNLVGFRKPHIWFQLMGQDILEVLELFFTGSKYAGFAPDRWFWEFRLLVMLEEIEKVERNKTHQEPDPELRKFAMLVCLVLSGGSKDKSCIFHTTALYKAGLLTVDALSRVENKEKIKETIKANGFYRLKTRNLRLMCCKMKEEFHGKVPTTYQGLVTLTGVGPKTAYLMLNECFNQYAGIGCDSHVTRCCRALGLGATTRSNTPRFGSNHAEASLRTWVGRHQYPDINKLLGCCGQLFTQRIGLRASHCNQRLAEQIGVVLTSHFPKKYQIEMMFSIIANVRAHYMTLPRSQRYSGSDSVEVEVDGRVDG